MSKEERHKCLSKLSNYREIFILRQINNPLSQLITFYSVVAHVFSQGLFTVISSKRNVLDV